MSAPPGFDPRDMPSFEGGPGFDSAPAPGHGAPPPQQGGFRRYDPSNPPPMPPAGGPAPSRFDEPTRGGYGGPPPPGGPPGGPGFDNAPPPGAGYGGYGGGGGYGRGGYDRGGYDRGGYGGGYGRGGYDRPPGDYGPPGGYDRGGYGGRGGGYDRGGYDRGGYGGGGGYGGRGGGYPPSDSYGAPGGGGGYDRPPTRAPAPLREPTNTVWLGGLDSMTDEALRETMSRFGKVLRISRPKTPGTCFVHYLTIEEATRAVDALGPTRELGPRVGVNYAKHFVYTPEELDAIERGGGARRSHEQMPSNILFVGDISPDIDEPVLRANFEGFGPIKLITRVESRNLAFIHYESVETCTHALNTMRNVPVAGRMLRLNYGQPQVDRPAATMRRDETPVNVVWLGKLPPSATQRDVDSLFAQFEGFIDSQFKGEKNMAFGDYESIEQAKNARLALEGHVMHGVSICAGYGNHNHTRTRLNPMGEGPPLAVGAGLDGRLIPAPGALVEAGLDGQLALLGEEGGPHGQILMPKYAARNRAAPTVGLDEKVAAVAAASYFQGVVPPPTVSSAQVRDIANAVDAVQDYGSAEKLQAQLQQASTNPPHAVGVVAKRLRELYRDDGHKKLYVAYAVTHYVHSHPSPRSLLDMLVVVLAVVGSGQCRQGAAYLQDLVDSVRRYLQEADPADQVIAQYLDSVTQKSKAANDLSALLAKVKGGA